MARLLLRPSLDPQRSMVAFFFFFLGGGGEAYCSPSSLLVRVNQPTLVPLFFFLSGPLSLVALAALSCPSAVHSLDSAINCTAFIIAVWSSTARPQSKRTAFRTSLYDAPRNEYNSAAWTLTRWSTWFDVTHAVKWATVGMIWLKIAQSEGHWWAVRVIFRRKCKSFK